MTEGDIWALGLWDGIGVPEQSFPPSPFHTSTQDLINYQTHRPTTSDKDERREQAFDELCAIKVKRKAKTNMNKRIKERQRRSKMTTAITELRSIVPRASKENQSVVVTLTVGYLHKLLAKVQTIEAENKRLRGKIAIAEGLTSTPKPAQDDNISIETSSASSTPPQSPSSNQGASSTLGWHPFTTSIV